jgi:hypothetical protein
MKGTSMFQIKFKAYFSQKIPQSIPSQYAPRTTLAIVSMVMLSACGLDAKFSSNKAQNEAQPNIERKDSPDTNRVLHLTVPPSVAEDKNSPLKVTPETKQILDNFLKDEVIQFTCDKDTGTTKSYVYLALYKRTYSSPKSDSNLNDIAYQNPDQLDFEGFSQKPAKPIKSPADSNFLPPPTPMTLGGLPSLGLFITAVAEAATVTKKDYYCDKFPNDDDYEWCKKQNNDFMGSKPKNKGKDQESEMGPVEGYGILVPYTCDKTANISVSLRTNQNNFIYNVYTRIYTPSGKATHEALSNAFTISTTSVELNLKPITTQVKVVVKNP